MRAIFCALPALVSCCLAIPPISPEIPIDRLLKNLNVYVQSHPKEAEAHYLLGRLHASAYLLGVNSKVPTVTPRPRPVLLHRGPSLRKQEKGGGDAYHLKQSIAEYQKAIALSNNHPVAYPYGYPFEMQLPPNKALAYLGLGWILEQSGDTQAALENYRRCYAIGAEQRSDDTNGRWGPGIEAADAIVRILKARPSRTGREAAELKQMEPSITALRKKLGVSISPIIFPLRAETSLAGLLDTTKTVQFDLEGNGLPAAWPWVNPGAAFLVWDPQHTGRITSGRQLFGSVTWWVFWDTGYQALAALDDNQDGWLTGEELTGIAVWHDVNSNGVSEPGEILGFSALNIKRIAVYPNMQLDRVPGHRTGIQFNDGHTAPTYDWMPVRSVEAKGLSRNNMTALSYILRGRI